MLRVCGAEGERDALSRSRCWCRGLFCGRGGGKRSAEFRREIHKTTIARTVGQFEDLLGQVDLFDGQALREKWLKRLGPRGVSHDERFRTRQNRRTAAPESDSV